MTAKAAIYVRQSVDHPEGIARSIKRCTALVKARDWTLVETFEDNNVSASKSRAHSRWADLLAGVKAGRYTHVVGVDIDRLVRDIRDLGDLIDTGAKVVTVDGEIDLTSADGEFRATMLTGIARFETRRKAERQVRANEDRVTRRGLPVPGKRRFGFEPGNIQERPEEAERVRWAFGQVLAGASIFGIAKALGRPPVRVREILANPSYAGYVTYGGDRYEAAPEVARIVDREDFEKVQAILAAPDRKVSPGNQIRHLASGLARCGVCESRMVKQGPNYLCKTDLSHPTIKAAMLDDHLTGEAFTYLMSTTAEADPEGLAEAVAEVAELTRKRAVVQDMATWDGADVATLKTQLAKLGKEIERASAKVDALRVQTVAGDVVDRIRAEIRRLQDDPSIEADEELYATWLTLWEGLDLTDQREVLSNMTIHVAKGRGLDRVSVSW